MVIVIGKIMLERKAKVGLELKQRIPGLGITLSKKVCMLAGCKYYISGRKLKYKQESKIVKVMKKYKGLIHFFFDKKIKLYNSFRLKDKAYRFLRYKKGYPINQRTRSNANTAAKRKKLQAVEIIFKKGRVRNRNRQKKNERKKGTSKRKNKKRK